jgi:uncharacterized protein (TIGR02996 family)
VHELLDAIAQAPDDDSIRRVYADALLDRGEPLGELIHLQLDLEQRLARPHANARRRRIQELLAAHEKRWTAALDGLAVSPSFRRGFVDEVTVDAEVFVARGAELFERAPLLSAVRLDGLVADAAAEALIQRFVAVLESPHLERLAGLGYSIGVWEPRSDAEWPGNKHSLGDVAIGLLVAALPRLPKLVRLAPEPWDLDFTAPDFLARFVELDLSAMHDVTIARILDAMPTAGRLRRLTLGTSYRAILGHPCIAALERVSARLPIENAFRKIRRLEVAPHLTHLVELDLATG